jgi:hypothetical protein
VRVIVVGEKGKGMPNCSVKYEDKWVEKLRTR